jgi:hypothetical protein
MYLYNSLSVFGFGKHKGIPVWAVAVSYPSYIDWCLKTIEDFAITDLERLENLPLIRVDQNSEESKALAAQLKVEMDKRPELYKSIIPEPYDITEYLKEKGYRFYLRYFKPFLTIYHTYSIDTKEENAKCAKELKSELDRLESDSYHEEKNYDQERKFEKYNGAYGFDDETIDNAFEGDPENYWNID